MERKVAFLWIGVACLVFIASPLYASWLPNGVPLCTSSGDQTTSQIVPDGTGGAIVVWREVGDLDFDLYAQRIDPNGAALWTVNGIAVTTAPERQAIHTVTSDGTGGAIIAWIDNRNDAGDIYAQRIDASGAVQWTADGMVVCSATGEQTYPHVVSDGAGGVIIAWTDGRTTVDTDVYVQRVNAGGVVQWATNGVVVCAVSGDQYNVKVLRDAAGGAVIAWTDERGTDSDIYVQRVNAGGTVQWTADGVNICSASGDQYTPDLVPDDAGGIVIAWRDTRDAYEDIFAQRVDAGGTALWTGDGIVVHNATMGVFHFFRIIADNNGGAIVTWQDGRDIADFDVYAQRVNSSGSILWPSGGLPICTESGHQKNPDIATDGDDGAIITWCDERGSDVDVYAQKIDGSGAAQWTTDGTSVCTAAGDQTGCAITSAGTGGAIAAWTDARDSDDDIYAMRVANPTPSTALPSSRVRARLHQNLPNPFNPSTRIEYYLPERRRVVIEIFDVSGRRVAQFLEGEQGEGYHDVNWNGQYADGRLARSGIYFYRLTAGDEQVTRKMVLMR